jgi:hypothetical protein
MMNMMGSATGEQKMKAVNIDMANIAKQRALQQGQIEKESWDLKKKMAEQSGSLASQFLSAWMGGVSEIGDILKGGAEGTAMGGVMGMMQDISNKIGQEYESYKADFGGAEKDFIGQAREEAGARREMVGQVTDLATPDLEGAAGRAGADVAGQSAMARESMQREAMGLGVDPSSGRFGALQKKSFVDEARNRSIAMNVARRGEKERVGNLAVSALSKLDPNVSGRMALGIREQGTKMLGQQADVAKGIGDVATQYSKNVMQPYAQMAGYFMGQGGTSGVSTNINL